MIAKTCPVCLDGFLARGADIYCPKRTCRALSHVEIDGEHILWRGSSSHRGHPQMAIRHLGKRTNTNPRRTLWVEENGPVPEGHNLRVTCDQPLCIAPRHVAPVSRREITRQVRKFSIETVVAVRQDYAGGASLTEVAKRHGIDRKTIHGIVIGKTYADHPGPITRRK